MLQRKYQDKTSGGGQKKNTKVEISHLFHEEFQGIVIEILNKLEDIRSLT